MIINVHNTLTLLNIMKADRTTTNETVSYGYIIELLFRFCLQIMKQIEIGEK